MVRRRLFNFAAVVSLLLCMASLAVWVLGHDRPTLFSSGGVRAFYEPYKRRVPLDLSRDEVLAWFEIESGK